MKKFLFIVIAVVIGYNASAQYEKEDGGDEKKGFKKENLFTGGSVTVSFYRGGSVLGMNPYFGYSLNRFIDVAAMANFNYASQRDIQILGDKLRQTVWGPGAFIRIYPVKFLFAQAQYEYNFTKQKYIAVPNSGFPNDVYKTQAPSTLVGGGYCSGRFGTGDTFYYFSVMWDVQKNINSPYVDELRRAVPIMKAGLQIGLFQGGGNRTAER